jgi:transposase
MDTVGEFEWRGRIVAPEVARAVSAVIAGESISAAAKQHDFVLITLQRWCARLGVRSAHTPVNYQGDAPAPLPESMQRAVVSVAGGMSTRAAATLHGVAASSLARHCKHRRVHSGLTGREYSDRLREILYG